MSTPTNRFPATCTRGQHERFADSPSSRSRGAPRERGRQHGEAARERIGLSIEAYRGAFAAASGLTWERVCGLAPQWLPLVEAYNGPELVEELHGIAEGAGVTLGDVLALNGRGDLSYTNPFETEECSAWAILDEVSPDGHVYCGQNWTGASRRRTR